ncbi:MAG: class SAM-dependent methyltransferase [Fibrobacteres bacterium]|nr:class SAM-dependent methyltransferase [Fibrobacterota bacterium]
MESEFKTGHSIETITKIAYSKGKSFRDELERSENPNYMFRPLQIFLDAFSIDLKNKKILDFGCGAGAFALNLVKLGADELVGVEVEEGLIDIARLRVHDFYPESRFKIIPIQYIDGNYRLPFGDAEFDIVWPHAVLEHVFPNQRGFVLQELWRVLKPNGTFILDGTPNGLWIKEAHTSNLFFINYLPLEMAAFFARRFSSRVPRNQSTENLLVRGFRGSHYWEISKYLPGAEWVGLQTRKEFSVKIKSWLRESDSPIKSAMKKAIGLILLIIDPVLRLLRLPQTAVMPWLLVVLRKK